MTAVNEGQPVTGAKPVANFMTGAVRYKDGLVDELVVYCLDPLTPEMEDQGFLNDDYVAGAEDVIENIKRGLIYCAHFNGSTKMHPLEVVVVNGIETLEIMDLGQPAEYRRLHNLGLPGRNFQLGQCQANSFGTMSEGQVGELIEEIRRLLPSEADTNEIRISIYFSERKDAYSVPEFMAQQAEAEKVLSH